MAYWRVRDPGSFPVAFHDAMRAGVGKGKLIGRKLTHEGAQGVQKDWRLFRHALRNHPSAAVAYWEPRLVHRTEIVWNEQLKVWDVLLNSRPKGLQDLVSMG